MEDQSKNIASVTSPTAPDNTMGPMAVEVASGGSKRHRSSSPNTGPRKRIQSGKSDARGSCSEVNKGIQQHNSTTPPIGVEGLIWAFKRQPLCDSQAYFRSHQGGTYTKNKVIQGLLVAGSVEVRDSLGRDTLITCCGGGRKQTKDGSWIRATSTEVPGTLESWKNAKAEQQPVLVIIANDHPAFKTLELSSIPRDAQYVVLGAFFVTEIWQEMGVALSKLEIAGNGDEHTSASPLTLEPNPGELNKAPKTAQRKTTKNQGKVVKEKSKDVDHQMEYPIYKLKLQRVNLAEEPIYWKEDDGTLEGEEASTPCQGYHCEICGIESPKAFRGKDLCLNSMCGEFFHENGKQLSACNQSLQYSKNFINSTKPFTGDDSKVPTGFQPPPMNDENGWGSEKAFRMGMVCPDCGCCNSRAHWNFWNCINCGYIYNSEPKPYPMSEVNKEISKHNNKFLRRKQAQYQTFKVDQTTISMDNHFVSMFTNETDQERDSVITTYMIFNQSHEFLGSVVHERPSQATLQMSGGSDELFQEAQESMDIMYLKRNPCRCVDSRIETLTRHFQHNFGVIYEFGVSPDNTSFNDSPDIVLKSLTQLTYFGQRAVESSQKIFSSQQWEKLEGSTIMDPWVPPNELLALAYMEDDSISYHDDGEDQLNGVISTLSLGSPAVMKLRLKKAKKNKGTKKNGNQDDEHVADEEKNEKGSNKPVLEIQLRHGDVVTMCDTKLQAFTEHTVQPVGLRRFAMTSRFINTHYYDEGEPAEKLKKSNRTTDDLRCLGELPARAAQFSFKGTKLEPRHV